MLLEALLLIRLARAKDLLVVVVFIVQDGQVRVVSEATDPERESAGTLLTFIDPRV